MRDDFNHRIKLGKKTIPTSSTSSEISVAAGPLGSDLSVQMKSEAVLGQL